MKRDLRFYCFSPPVMIATFLIEFSMAAYTLWRYKLNPTTRVIVALLIFLGTFQVAEFNVCRTIMTTQAWSRVGFMAITMLPPLALHLVLLLAKRKWNWLIALAYASGLAFALFLGLSATAFANHFCAGNYVIFRLANNVGGMYFTYYYFWLFVGLALSLYFSLSATDQKTREPLILQGMGYLVFLLPTMVVNTVSPSTIEGLPSIMCGFAVLYAFILTFGILPMVAKKK